MNRAELDQHVQAGVITEKEAEVLELHHLSDRKISIALEISRRAVRERRKNAIRKIDLYNSRSENDAAA